MLTCGDLVTT